MRWLFAYLTRPSQADETGSSIMLVLMVTTLLTSLMGALVLNTQTLMALSNHSQNFHSTNAALSAGVEDYLYRVNSDPQYTRYANTPATNCPYVANTPTIDTSNPYMQANQPIELNGQTTTTTNNPKLRYSVDVSKVCSEGYITLTVTGNVGQVTKTMNYQLRKKAFTDYMYFTDYEQIDPQRYPTFLANMFTPNTPTQITSQCQRHHDETSPSGLPAPRREYALYFTNPTTNTPPCASVTWSYGESVQGEIHTNDSLFICGNPTFYGKVTTSWKGDGTKHWIANTAPGCGTGAPWFAGNESGNYCSTANDACYEDPLFMPQNNYELGRLPGTCVYDGPTNFTLHTNNTIDVYSPYTTYTALCGGGTNLATITAPPSGVIYVRDVPATVDPGEPSPAHISQAQANARAGTCPTVAGGRTSNKLGFPRQDSATGKYDITNYGCYDGDAFVVGGFTGKLTIAAENRLVLTGNVYGLDDNQAPIGMIGNRGVEIYHPVIDNGNGTFTNISGPVNSIDGAILAVNNTFTVQNYDKGAFLGQLYVWGSIAQQWRGSVGTLGNTSGYRKNYEYAQVLKYSTPPNFLTPTNAVWGVVKRELG